MNYRNWQLCHWYLLNECMTKVPEGHFLPQPLMPQRHTRILGRFSAEFRDLRWTHVFLIPQRRGDGDGRVGASETQLKPPRQFPACTTQTLVPAAAARVASVNGYCGSGGCVLVPPTVIWITVSPTSYYHAGAVEMRITRKWSWINWGQISFKSGP